jgi:hypothetical protein
MLTNVALPATDYEEITVSTTAVGLTVAKFHAAERATIRVLSNSVNVRRDGGVPTNASGLTYAADTMFTVYGQRDMAHFLAIRVTNDAKLCVTYEGSR